MKLAESSALPVVKAKKSPGEKYRLIFWGLGSVGGTTLKAALERPEFEVVGARVYSGSKNGVDIGVLAGMAPIGIKATHNWRELLDLDADCVIHTPLAVDPASMNAEVIELLASGKNVVSTAAYHYPLTRGAEYAVPLQKACERGGSTLMGAGIHPNFVVGNLVLPLTGMMTSINHIRLVESLNLDRLLSSMGASELVGALGFGQDPGLMDPHSPAAVMLDVYYDEIAGFIAKRLFNAEAEQVRTVHALTGVPAGRDYEFANIPGLKIKKGTTLTVLRTQKAYIGDHHFFTNEDVWYLGEENRYPKNDAMPFGGMTGAVSYAIEIDGKPNVAKVQLDVEESTLHGAPPSVTAVSVATLLQSVIPACNAAPGFLYRETSTHYAKDLRTLAH